MPNKFCKKCGKELASCNDSNLCQNCLHKRGKLIKTVAATAIALTPTIIKLTPEIIKIVKKIKK